jgi:beta-glucosidase
MSKFFWGAATSAYQVEGNNHNDWSEFERARGLEQSGVACDHYNRFNEDFDIARGLKHNAHRLSIEWSRIEPRENEWNEEEIKHYQQVVYSLKRKNIEPFVTLWHWTLPLWLRDKDGWLSTDSIELFERYVEVMIKALPEVKYWVTINEPNVYSSHGYMKGNWPPGIHSLSKFFRVNRKLVLAHTKAYKIIKDLREDANVGIAHNMIYFSSIGSKLKNHFWNEWHLDKIGQCQDFIGINYYFSDRKTDSVSDMGWSIDPEGFYEVLKSVKRYNKPVFVLENGIADAKDERRGAFIRDHIGAMKQAMEDGVDIRGYFYWSLLDNFEWDSGFKPRFGLTEIDYKTQRRILRKSASDYMGLID